MKTLYIAIASAIAAVVSGTLIWKNRKKIHDFSCELSGTAKTKARSVWGKVENAASNLVHTEKDPVANT